MRSFEVVYVRPRLHGPVSLCWWGSFHVTEELAIVALGRFLCPESHSTSRCSRASSPSKHWPRTADVQRHAPGRCAHLPNCSGIICVPLHASAVPEKLSEFLAISNIKCFGGLSRTVSVCPSASCRRQHGTSTTTYFIDDYRTRITLSTTARCVSSSFFTASVCN